MAPHGLLRLSFTLRADLSTNDCAGTLGSSATDAQLVRPNRFGSSKTLRIIPLTLSAGLQVSRLLPVPNWRLRRNARAASRLAVSLYAGLSCSDGQEHGVQHQTHQPARRAPMSRLSLQSALCDVAARSKIRNASTSPSRRSPQTPAPWRPRRCLLSSSPDPELGASRCSSTAPKFGDATQLAAQGTGNLAFHGVQREGKKRSQHDFAEAPDTRSKQKWQCLSQSCEQISLGSLPTPPDSAVARARLHIPSAWTLDSPQIESSRSLEDEVVRRAEDLRGLASAGNRLPSPAPSSDAHVNRNISPSRDRGPSFTLSEEHDDAEPDNLPCDVSDAVGSDCIKWYVPLTPESSLIF